MSFSESRRSHALTRTLTTHNVALSLTITMTRSHSRTHAFIAMTQTLAHSRRLTKIHECVLLKLGHVSKRLKKKKKRKASTKRKTLSTTTGPAHALGAFARARSNWVLLDDFCFVTRSRESKMPTDTSDMEVSTRWAAVKTKVRALVFLALHKMMQKLRPEALRKSVSFRVFAGKAF